MKCPVCNIDMIAVEFNKIEIDHCVKCLGVWFDAGEVELLFKSSQAGQALPDSLFGPGEMRPDEKNRKCPICGRKMKKAPISDEHEVFVDVCTRNHGLWFDSGEVEHLAGEVSRKTGGKPDSEIVAYLGDVFRKTNN